MDGSSQEFDEFIQRVRAGNESACHEFWGHYGPLVERVAQKHLSGGIQRRVGPESVTLSACRTFFRRAQAGEFELNDPEGLWRLLCVITVNKIRTKIRFHQRQKREAAAEVPIDQTIEPMAAALGPEEEAAFADQLEHLLKQFDEDEQRVLDLRLQQFSNAQIASTLECSERTVRRMLSRIQARMRQFFD